MYNLSYFLTNGIFAVLVYLATVKESVGAEYVVVFGVWILFVVSILYTYAADDNPADLIKKLPNRKPTTSNIMKYDYGFDTVITLVVVWHGWLFIGLLYMLHAVFIYSGKKKLEEYERLL